MSPRRCHTIQVGETFARVYADGPLTQRDIDALTEIAFAVQRRMFDADPLPPEVIAAETWYNQALERSAP